jgi:hypothetical protein
MPFKALMVLAMCVVPTYLVSQTPTSNLPLPAGWVDGSKSPELIPDHSSYRLVLTHLCSVISAPILKQSATYSQIGLSAADTLVLQNQVVAFDASYSQWKAQAALSPSANDEQNAQAIVLATRDALIKRLTPGGASRFVQYVQQEKAHMIVRP